MTEECSCRQYCIVITTNSHKYYKTRPFRLMTESYQLIADMWKNGDEHCRSHARGIQLTNVDTCKSTHTYARNGLCALITV